MDSADDSGANAWNPDRYDDDHAFVHEYGGDVIDHLDHDSGGRLLDLGCGTGHLTARLAERGWSVVGVDSSAAMVARARERYPDLEFVHADARTLDEEFDDAFDAVFSNAALHWIPDRDQAAVLASVSDCLRSGGQFVAEFGGDGNVSTIVAAVETELDERGYGGENPWYFPSIGGYTPRLEAHGFEVRSAALFDRPTALDGDDGLRGWLAMFGDSLLAGVPDDELESVLAAIASRLEPTLREDGTWYADYRRLRFRAVSP